MWRVEMVQWKTQAMTYALAGIMALGSSILFPPKASAQSTIWFEADPYVENYQSEQNNYQRIFCPYGYDVQPTCGPGYGGQLREVRIYCYWDGILSGKSGGNWIWVSTTTPPAEDFGHGYCYGNGPGTDFPSTDEYVVRLYIEAVYNNGTKIGAFGAPQSVLIYVP